MIEGRPRESLVQYENPIEVSNTALICLIDLCRPRSQGPFQEDFWL
jgi:hypothetical protein